MPAVGRASGRRPRAHRRAARRVHDRRRHRRADAGFRRRRRAPWSITASACARSATTHGILLIFDEVICGFGRMGDWFGAQALRRRARPDHVRQAREQRHGADGRRHRPPGHLRHVHDRPGTHGGTLPRFTRIPRIRSRSPRRTRRSTSRMKTKCRSSSRRWAGRSKTPCIRSRASRTSSTSATCGFAAAVELAPLPGQPGMRGLRLFEEGLKRGMLLRSPGGGGGGGGGEGDTIAMAPPVVTTPDELHRMIEARTRSPSAPSFSGLS